MSLLAISVLVHLYECNAECNYLWVDHTDVNFNPYESTLHASHMDDDEGCVALDRETYSWKERDCKETLPFICNNCGDVINREPQPINYIVPSEGSEYQTLDWNDANGYCEHDCHSSLASIHDLQQQGFIRDIFKQGSSYFDNEDGTCEHCMVWIGLYREGYCDDITTMTPSADTTTIITISNRNSGKKPGSAKFMGMAAEAGIFLLVLTLIFVGCIVAIIGWWCYSKQKKQNKEMQKEMDVIQKKLSELESHGSVPSNGSSFPQFPVAKTSQRVLPGADEEGNGNIEMQEGMQQEGHTKITKIESAIHLEVLPGDEYKNDDDNDEKDNVLLDEMLSDVMKMPSLDPNQISEVNDNEIVQKRNNQSESENTDDMYDDEQNDEQNDEQVIGNRNKNVDMDEKPEVNEYEENAMDLEIKQTKIDRGEDNDEDKDKMNGNNEILVDTNEMEKGIDNNMENEQNKENNENESEDSDNMYV